MIFFLEGFKRLFEVTFVKDIKDNVLFVTIID